MNEKFKEIDTKELDLPETTFSRDIESKVFQAIVFQAISKIEGIHLVSKGLIDSLLGRDSQESYSAIHVDQDQKKHSVSIKLELNINFGISIPEKSEEIQTKVIESISTYTGLHVNCVHVVFKNILTEDNQTDEDLDEEVLETVTSDEEYEGF